VLAARLPQLRSGRSAKTSLLDLRQEREWNLVKRATAAEDVRSNEWHQAETYYWMLIDRQNRTKFTGLQEVNLYLVPGETTSDSLFVVESVFSSSNGLVHTETPAGWENRKKIPPPERTPLSAESLLASLFGISSKPSR
jgi:hypothetical protein